MKITFLVFCLIFITSFLKSQEVVLLDSTVIFDFNTPDDSIFFQKMTYEYIDENKYAENIFSWDTTLNSWNHSAIKEYAYNENDSLLLYARYHYNSYLSSWLGDSKTQTIYKEDGKSKLVYEFDWDINLNDWKYKERTDREYNSNSEILLYAEYVWSNDLEDWGALTKTETVYGNNIKTELNYKTVIGIYEWELYTKKEYYYNSRNQLDSCFLYYWDENDSTRTNISKSILSYDTINYTSTENYYEWKWNSDTIKWNLEEIFERQYNSDWQLTDQKRNILDDEGNLIRTIHLFYKYYPNGKLSDYTYEKNIKYHYEYTDSGERYVNELYFWDGSKNSWKGSFKFTESHSSDGLKIYHISEKWDSELSQWYISSKNTIYLNENKEVLLRVSHDLNRDTQVWELKQKQYYYYSPYTGSIEINNVKVGIYPNPFSDNILISGNEVPTLIQIFNSDGKMILQKPIKNQQVSVRELPTGTYIVRILKNKQILKTEKIIKL